MTLNKNHKKAFLFFCGLTILLCVALFTGCGEKERKWNGVVNLPGGVKMYMVKVEAGTFEMSSRDGENKSEEVPHRVTLTRDFYISKTEVTQAQWRAVMGSNPSHFTGDNLPVENVSWDEAKEFCIQLILACLKEQPKGYRFDLPTETQWEYAARGGKYGCGYKYSGSNNADEVAWYYENSGDTRLDDSSWNANALVPMFAPTLGRNHCKTHPVGTKKANELGLYDMSGNVEEWCLDDWQERSDMLTAELLITADLKGPRRAIRGGGWNLRAEDSRSGERGSLTPDVKADYIGFRVALVRNY